MRPFQFELNERAGQLLKHMIESYIRDGEPVGSQTLARETQLGSPATIRNVMASLEDKGLITSPHTSAGRIPTPMGYRFFVDTLVSTQSPKDQEKQEAREALGPDQAQDVLLQAATNVLANLTHFASVVMLPRPERQILRHLEFIPLEGQRILVILVLNDKEIQNRIIRLNEPLSAGELQEIANYLNQEFAGIDLHQVQMKLVQGLESDQKKINRMTQMAVKVARSAFTEPRREADFLLRGETHLLSMAEESGMENLQQLFQAFSQKQMILNVLENMAQAEGLQVYIGEEAGLDALKASSIITAPYVLSNQVVGVLGVIGPTRMPYDRVLPLVDMTAKLLSVALNSQESPPT